MPQYHRQVTGGACSMTMYRETSPGCVPAGTKGVKLAFFNENFARGATKDQSAVITGKRGPGKPALVLPTFTGQVTSAPYSPQMGYLFSALCGDPVSVADGARTLNAAPVVDITDCRKRAVGLPCTDHGFVQDAVITVYGTGNYDGEYRVVYGTTKDIIAIHAPYVAETLPATAKVYRGRAPLLEGDAEDMGDGLVGLPTALGVHDLNTGDSVVISGTTNYDGTYTLQTQCGEGKLIIEHAYTAETFDGTPIAVPQFYRHSWALPKTQPTVCMEKFLDFDPDAEAERYQQFYLCKVSGIGWALGGTDELRFTVDFGVGRQEDSATPLDATPLTPPAVRIDNIEAAIWLANERRGDIDTATFTNNFQIVPRSAIGDLGEYSRMNEGDPQCSAELQAYMEEGDYKALAVGRYSLPFAVSIDGAAGDECWFRWGETEIDVPGQPITGKEGLMQTVNVLGYVDCRNAVMEMELINRVASYAA
jgi:hypothetical protein